MPFEWRLLSYRGTNDTGNTDGLALMLGSSLDTRNLTLSQPVSGGSQRLPVLVSMTVALLKLFCSSTILRQSKKTKKKNEYVDRVRVKQGLGFRPS